jgi:hypothetical protein
VTEFGIKRNEGTEERQMERRGKRVRSEHRQDSEE